MAPARDDREYLNVREWVGMVSRLRLADVVSGVRKGTYANEPTVKAVAFRLALYADMDGSRIHPSTARIALDCGISYQLAKRIMAGLRGLGLISRGRRDGSRGVTPYRLSLPRGDVLARLRFPSPDEYEAMVQEIADRAVHKRPSTGDAVNRRETASTGDGGNEKPASTGDGGNARRVTGSPPIPNTDQPQLLPNTSPADLRTDLDVVSHPQARGAA